MKDYQFLIHEQTYTRVESYLGKLHAGASTGRYLNHQLQSVNLKDISTTNFLNALIKTKRPQIFAESEVSGDGSDWDQAELSILGDISVGIPVTVFDNGLHDRPELYQTPFKANLVFTPGALLRNDQGKTPGIGRK